MFNKNQNKIINNSFLKEIDFKCQRCSVCCRIFPGAVYLTKKDISKITTSILFSFTSHGLVGGPGLNILSNIPKVFHI